MESVCIKKRPRNMRRRAARVAALGLACLLVAAVLFGRALGSQLSAAAKEAVSDSVSRGLTQAASRAMTGADTLSMLSITETGEESYVISADTAAANALASRIEAIAQELVAGEGEKGVSISLGNASGIAFIAGAGPKAHFRFTPMGSVKGSLSSSLRSAGINQSLYTLELTLTASVRVLLAGRDETVTIKTAVPICQTVVVGKVPQVYTNVANEEDMLNLIPTDLP